ncbi:MAG: hypothetical protein RLZZ227_569 [Pseudomonadota bacterium]|jgi:hypothetical protein
MLALFAPVIVFAQAGREAAARDASIPATERAAIGSILTMRGLIRARAASGETRTLLPRSELFVGDTVLVDADAFVSMRMVDKAHLSLGADTEFVFAEYSYAGHRTGGDRAIMTLARGCFRSRSGSIGSAARDEYRIDTPVASIHADESFHGATLANQRLYSSTWGGSALVSNAQGSLNLGGYGDYDFSRTSIGDAPKGLQALMPGLDCAPPDSLDELLDHND